jgi:hypothetical protein
VMGSSPECSLIMHAVCELRSSLGGHMEHHSTLSVFRLIRE